jgi:hypothetical protein
MLSHERTIEREAAARTEVENELAFDRRAADRNHRSVDNRMTLLIKLDGNGFARPGVSELILVVKPDQAGSIVDFDDKLFNEIAADDAVKGMSEPR